MKMRIILILIEDIENDNENHSQLGGSSPQPTLYIV